MSFPAVNSVAWFEIGTDRADGVKEFYGQLFGWAATLNTNLPGVNYHAVATSDAPQPSGGVWESEGKFPNYAIFYVLVEDVAASVERAEELGSHLRACGREPLPVTALDLGERTATPSSCGARTWRSGATAFERIGRFDEALGGAGDEEDWQRRLRAAGGSVGYVAAAGVDHRRTGRDAHLRNSARAVLLPRPRRAPLRRLPRPRALAARGAAHAGRLPVAHRPPPLRGRGDDGRALATAAWRRRSIPRPRRPTPPTRTTCRAARARSAAARCSVGAAKDAARRAGPARAGSRSGARPAALPRAAGARRRRRAPGAPAHGRAPAPRALALHARRRACTWSRPRRAPASGRTSTPRCAPRRSATPTGC